MIGAGMISSLVLCPCFLKVFTGLAKMIIFIFTGAAIPISSISSICYSAEQRFRKDYGNSACR